MISLLRLMITSADNDIPAYFIMVYRLKICSVVTRHLIIFSRSSRAGGKFRRSIDFAGAKGAKRRNSEIFYLPRRPTRRPREIGTRVPRARSLRDLWFRIRVLQRGVISVEEGRGGEGGQGKISPPWGLTTTSS